MSVSPLALSYTSTIQKGSTFSNSNTTYPYVIVDPVSGAVVNSSIPKGVDPGQNNEGYAYATIQTPATSGECDAGFDADVSVTNDSMSGSVTANARGVLKRPKDRKKTAPKQISAFPNIPMQIKVKVYSDKPHELFGHLMIYQGNPRKGQLIADKIVHFGSTRGAIATFNWTPGKAGKHRLFAVIVPYRDNPDMTNHVAKIKVNVVRLKGTNPPK